MSFPGYGITFFDPKQPPTDYSTVVEFLDEEYFIKKFNEQWIGGNTWYTFDKNSLVWTIPSLESGDPDLDFTGLFTFRDKGISFRNATSHTIYVFVKWIRSIVAPNYPVYLIKLSEFTTLDILNGTSEEDIVRFLAQAQT